MGVHGRIKESGGKVQKKEKHGNSRETSEEKTKRKVWHGREKKYEGKSYGEDKKAGKKNK